MMETTSREQSGWSAALLNVQEIIMAEYKGGGGAGGVFRSQDFNMWLSHV